MTFDRAAEQISEPTSGQIDSKGRGAVEGHGHLNEAPLMCDINEAQKLYDLVDNHCRQAWSPMRDALRSKVVELICTLREMDSRPARAE